MKYLTDHRSQPEVESILTKETNWELIGKTIYGPIYWNRLTGEILKAYLNKYVYEQAL